jgi:hypothetical protein
MANKKILDSDDDVKVKLLWRDVKSAENHRGLIVIKDDRPGKPIVTWLRTSQFFDGLVNTPARILINVMSILALYVWTIDVANKEHNLLAWVITLMVLLFMQAASVRFVFNTEGVADEFQETKRNLAYRRAYRTIRRIALIPVGLFAFLVVAGPHGDANLLWDFVAYRLDNYRSLTLAIFIFAVSSFQKYFSYGWVGEPFTVREKSSIKD